LAQLHLSWLDREDFTFLACKRAFHPEYAGEVDLPAVINLGLFEKVYNVLMVEVLDFHLLDTPEQQPDNVVVRARRVGLPVLRTPAGEYNNFKGGVETSRERNTQDLVVGETLETECLNNSLKSFDRRFHYFWAQYTCPCPPPCAKRKTWVST